MTPKQQYEPGRRKISETFLRFSAPVLESMPEDATSSEIEKVLILPCTIWNALVFDHAAGTQEYVSRVRETFAPDPVGAAFVEDLIERKQTEFRDDQLLIGEYRVTKLGPEELNLWAEARDPYSAIENQPKPNNPSERRST